MKTKKITLATTIIVLSVLIFSLIAYFWVSPALKSLYTTLDSLQTNKLIYESDFEKVYSHANYSINLKDNLIVVELQENGCTLVLHYTQDKTFITSYIKDYDFQTSPITSGIIWLLVAMLSIALSVLMIMIGIGIWGWFKQ